MWLSDLIPTGAETGSGLALQHRGRYLFMLAGRRYDLPAGSTFFAGIGGHCEPGETWLDCARREAQEELGAGVAIRSATATTYIDHNLAARPVALEDEPRPLCIYELWNPPDASWNKRGAGYVYYVVVYEATLDDSLRPSPQDLDAILWLSAEQVSLAARVPTTLQAVLAEGAEVAGKAPLPDPCIIRPQGTARALASLWEAQCEA